MKIPFTKRKRPGQVMIYMVVILIFVLVMCFFLFDLHTMIHTRHKTQTGVDSAALSAARWQGQTMNMVGELNLVKGTTMMLTAFPPYEADDVTELQASAAMVDEMQTRLLYVGPLMGYQSAQIAAKNNGVYEQSSFTDYLQSHIDNALSDRGDGSDPCTNGSYYEQIYCDSLNYYGYSWHDGYREMLQDIVSDGIAAGSYQSRYLSQANILIDINGTCYNGIEFMVALVREDYCWFINNGFDPEEAHTVEPCSTAVVVSDFFPGSELLNLYLDFSGGNFAEMSGLTSSYLPDRSLTHIDPVDPNDPTIIDQDMQDALDALNWLVFAGKWDDINNYDLFETYDFLRSSIRSEYVFGGPASYFGTKTEPGLISGRWDWEPGKKDTGGQANLGNALDIGPEGVDQQKERLKRSEDRLRQLRNNASVESTSMAKALGMLDSGGAPNDAGIVLPVFHDVRLMPVSLVDPNDAQTGDKFPNIYLFLVEYYGSPDYPDVPPQVINKYQFYLEYIEAFETEGSYWRQNWAEFVAYREEVLAGPDGEIGTDDDGVDICAPPVIGGPGGPGGGGSRPGPPIMH